MQRTEIFCHECQNNVRFDLDTEKDGNHVLVCPVCGHEHCRVVRKEVVTGDRWDQRNGVPTYYYTAANSTTMTCSTTASESNLWQFHTYGSATTAGAW